MGLWGSVGVLTFNFAQYHEQTVRLETASCGKSTDYQTLRVQNIVAPADIILNAFFWPALQRLSCTPATLGLKRLSPCSNRTRILCEMLRPAESI